MKNKSLLHKTEKLILIHLNKSLVPLSMNKIARDLNISYVTARKYLNSLEKKQLIKRIQNGTKKNKK